MFSDMVCSSLFCEWTIAIFASLLYIVISIVSFTIIAWIISLMGATKARWLGNSDDDVKKFCGDTKNPITWIKSR